MKHRTSRSSSSKSKRAKDLEGAEADRELEEAKAKVELFTNMYIEKSAAYDAAYQLVEELEEELPPDIVEHYFDLQDEEDREEAKLIRANLKSELNSLDEKTRKSFSKWKRALTKLDMLKEDRIEAERRATAADKVYEDLRNREKASEGASSSSNRASRSSIEQVKNQLLKNLKYVNQTLMPYKVDISHPHATVVNKAGLTIAPGTKRPDLLVQGLDKINSRAPTGIVEQLLIYEKTNGIFSVSGAGKTRATFELLCCKYGIYLIVERTGRGYGSEDMSSAISYCKERGNRISLERKKDGLVVTVKSRERLQQFWDEVNHVIRCVMLARYLVYEHLQTIDKNLTPHKWLLIQLYPLHFLGSDIFLGVSESLRDLEHKEIIRKLNLFNLNSCVGILDEAQLLVGVLPKSFQSQNDIDMNSSVASRDLLSPVVKELSRRFSTFFACGTGLSLQALTTVIGSSMGLRETRKYFDAIPMFDKGAVRRYLEQFLSLSSDQLDQAAEVLHGRARFSAEFVVQCLENSAGETFPLEWYKEQMTTEKGLRTGNNSFLGPEISTPYGLLKRFEDRSVLHDGVEIQKLVKRASIHYKVFGTPYLFSGNELQVVEQGVAPLVKFSRGRPDLQQKAAMSEPLMLMAADSVFDVSKDLQDLLSEISVVPSATGFIMEHLLAETMRKKFEKGMELEKFAKSFGGGDVPKQFHGTFRMTLKPNELVKMSSSKYTLIEFLKNREQVYFIPENAAGPDGAFWLTDGSRKILVVLQSKFASTFDTTHALETISPATFYTAKPAKGTSDRAKNAEKTKQNNLKKKRNEVANLINRIDGIISILVCLPGEVPFGKLAPGLSQRDDGSLLLIIDRTNANNLFPNDVLQSFAALKPE